MYFLKKAMNLTIHTYDDCFPTSEILQLTVNNMYGNIWSNFGQKHASISGDECTFRARK